MNRINEVKILLYRILLVYINYSICRVLFIYFNNDLLQLSTTSEILKLLYQGLRFDSSAIAYFNFLFILLSIIPWVKTSSKNYQKFLIWIYFIFNGLGMFFNFVDFAYYRFNLNRMMSTFLEGIQAEVNKSVLLFHFIATYYYLFLIFIFILLVWIYFYKKIKIIRLPVKSIKSYYLSSVIVFFGVIVFGIIAARGGGFYRNSRPVSIIDAMDNLDNPQHADVVLNTPFTILKTILKKPFKKIDSFNEDEIASVIKPFKKYNNLNELQKPNVVIFILESMGREYWGSMNKNYLIPNYKSYTPFLDSLAKHSLIFPNAFATSRKSIHGMPSILAGIPSFEMSYSSSPYSKQKVESVVSIANSLGYDTSFFHGAANGSMGFLGFSNTLEFNNYYGKNEFNNNDEYDGYWGIWDEPFLKYTKSILDQKKSPFLSAVFTVSSHEPYNVPEKYKDTFDKGFIQMHQCVGYSDFSLAQFFKSAKNSEWFANTIFVFTADHSNQSYFPFYQKTVNRFANPIMIYQPESNLKGENKTLASHMDIYPTIVELMGYKKPFRSWGKSLLGENNEPSFIVNYLGGGSYFMMNEKFICVHNGKNAIGFYNIEDKNFENNLIKEKTEEMEALELKSSMYIQDYYNRIITGKMQYDEK